MHLTESSKVNSEHKVIFYLLNISEVLIASLTLLLKFFICNNRHIIISEAIK